MKLWTVVACVALLAALLIGCDAAARYRVLSTLFDGVPPPEPPRPVEDTPAADATSAAQSRQVGFRGHGPYAAKLCNACHEPGAMNALVVPREQLCFRCHEIRMDKKYIHGPLASGGCTSCHDPHSSQYRYLLVSESDNFCFYCHDRQTVATIGAHQGIEERCTACHDAHMSDKKYLLK